MRRLLILICSAAALSQHRNNVSFGAVLRNSGTAGTNNVNRVGGGWQYWCDPCACGFNKLRSYEEHVAGRRHTAVLEEEQGVWEEYTTTSGPAFYSPCVTRAEATRVWSLDIFCHGLRARSRSSVRTMLDSESGATTGQIDPRLMVSDLPPPKRAALWRFLRGVTPGLAAMVGALPPHNARVKELLESAEVFRHVQKLLKKCGSKEASRTIIYDVGCGHGLVGMLCAAAFPGVRVRAIDRSPRSSFDAQRDAFASTGMPLDNIVFKAGDLSVLADNDDERGLLLCVHGCKSLTHESIELASRKGWAWLVLPCCLQSEHHLDGTKLRLPDDKRFALLCGALAANHGAETVAFIDPRITARGIVLSSSGQTR